MDQLTNALITWDRQTFLAINRGLQSPVLDFLMPRISDIGLGHVQVLALLLVMGVRGRSILLKSGVAFGERVRTVIAGQRRWLVPMLLAFAISGLGATIFKQSIERDRPFWFYSHNEAGRALNAEVRTVPGRQPLRVRGFLSGHTSTSVALVVTATVLLRGRRKRALLAGLWSLVAVISFSRIYLADHWPLDVVGGVLLGIVSSAAALAISMRRERRREAEPADTESEPPFVTPCVAGSH